MTDTIVDPTPAETKTVVGVAKVLVCAEVPADCDDDRARRVLLRIPSGGRVQTVSVTDWGDGRFGDTREEQ